MAKALCAADLDDLGPRTLLLGVVDTSHDMPLITLHVYIAPGRRIEGVVYRSGDNQVMLVEAFDEETVRNTADYLCAHENLRLISDCCDGAVCHHLLASGAELPIDGRLRRPHEGIFAALTQTDFPKQQLAAARRQFASRYQGTDH